jgi:hypothetical protein
MENRILLKEKVVNSFPDEAVRKMQPAHWEILDEVIDRVLSGILLLEGKMPSTDFEICTAVGVELARRIRLHTTLKRGLS